MGNVNQYNEKAYKLAKDNTNNNSDGKAVIQELMSGVMRKNGMQCLSSYRKNRKILSSNTPPFYYQTAVITC